MKIIQIPILALVNLLSVLPANAQSQQNQFAIQPEVIGKVAEKHLNDGMLKYQALAAAAVIIDAKSGEVISSVSLQKTDIERCDLITNGVFEFGHVAKIATIAAGLEAKVITVKSKLDARYPLKIGKHTIGDYNPQNRMLSVQEVALYSSNIGAARIGLKIGGPYQSLFHKSLGFREQIEDGVQPLFPEKSEELTVAANAFGHGFAISPLHAVSAFATLTNPEGRLVRATFKKNQPSNSVSILSSETTAEIGRILRMNVEVGAAKVVDIPNLQVGAMTSTANKVKDGRYSIDHVITSTIAVVPYYDPKYVFFTMFDDPQFEDGVQFKTAAWNSGKVMSEILRESFKQ